MRRSSIAFKSRGGLGRGWVEPVRSADSLLVGHVPSGAPETPSPVVPSAVSLTGVFNSTLLEPGIDLAEWAGGLATTERRACQAAPGPLEAYAA